MQKAKSVPEFFACIRGEHPEIVFLTTEDRLLAFEFYGVASAANVQFLTSLLVDSEYSFDGVSVGSCDDCKFHFKPTDNDNDASVDDWLKFYEALAGVLVTAGPEHTPFLYDLVVDIPPTIRNAAVGVHELEKRLFGRPPKYIDMCAMTADLHVPHMDVWMKFFVKHLVVTCGARLDFTMWPSTSNRLTLAEMWRGVFGPPIRCSLSVTVPAAENDDERLSRDNINHDALDAMLDGMLRWIDVDSKQSARKRQHTTGTLYDAVRRLCGSDSARRFAMLQQHTNEIMDKTVRGDANYGVRIVTKRVRDDMAAPKHNAAIATNVFRHLTALDLNLFA